MRLSAQTAGADPAGDRPTRPVSIFRSWPADRDGLVALYPRNPSPTLRVNFIASADGAVTVDGLSGGLHGPGDKEIFDSLRMVCDALIVGAATVKAEKYDALRLTPEAREWRVAHGLPEFPLMVIVSSSLALDLDQLVFSDAPLRPVVLTHRDAPTDRLDEVAHAADVIAIGHGGIDLPAAISALHDLGARQLLCEGGPALLGAMIGQDLVTELCLTVSPLLVGGGPGRLATGASSLPRAMSLQHILTLQDMLFLRYARRT